MQSTQQAQRLMALGLLAVLVTTVCAVAVALYIAKRRRLAPGISFGSAGFGPWPGQQADSHDQLPPGLVLGRTEQGGLAGWSGEEHWLLIAPTGAGKSTGVLAPSIAGWRGSMLAIDVKGELARMCAPALQDSGCRCLRLDPFDLLADRPDIVNIRIDPVAQAAGARDPVAALHSLADLLIDPGAGTDVHWAESARLVVTGLLAAASAARGSGKRGLAGVVKAVDQGYGAVKVLEKMSWPQHIDRLVQRTASLLADAGANERGAIMSTIRRQLAFLAVPEARAALTGGWRMAELLDPEQDTALFIVLPAERLGDQARTLRLAVGSLVAAMLEAGVSRERRLLLVLDEAAALGKMAALEQGIGLFRGYGARFLLSFQDEQQLRATYGEAAAGSIKANCNAVYWGSRDLDTCEQVSAMLGDHTVVAASGDLGRAAAGASGQTQEREVGRRLLTAEEIRRLPAGNMIAFAAGARPARLRLLAPGELPHLALD